MYSENELSYLIRGAAFKIHSKLGPGLLESVYERTLAYELSNYGLEIKTQQAIALEYDNVRFDAGFRLDILVEDKVIIEVKSVEALSEIHHKQLLTYLKLSGKKLGLLINFNAIEIHKSIVRVVNNL